LRLRYKVLLLWAATSTAASAICWCVYGHDLTYDVYTGTVYLYTEDMDLAGRAIFSVGLGALIGAAISRGVLGALRARGTVRKGFRDRK
jgi:hypothetical protein